MNDVTLHNESSAAMTRPDQTLPKAEPTWPNAVAGQTHVVIVGGGFGGLLAAQSLKRAPVTVTLIDKNNYHLFQPLLYQVATGGLSPGDIASPLRSVLRRQKNTRVLMGEVTRVDPAQRRLWMGEREIGYDYLVVATGAGHHYFGHDEWAKRAPGLKTISDALEIRNRIFAAFEKAELESGSAARRRLLTFMVVGGGPTGVELAGAVGEIANYTLRHDFRNIDPTQARIILVEGLGRVLPTYPPHLSARAAKSLGRLGVEVRTGTRVTRIDETVVELAARGRTERVESSVILWAAGVRADGLAPMLVADPETALDPAGRVLVEPDLTAPGHPEIFVIGDLANFRHQTGSPLPGVAPVAMSQGRYVARAIRRRLSGKPLKPYRYLNKGNLATIGRAAAVADFGFFRFWGFPAWLLWLFVHLMYLVEFDNRLLVLVQWGWNYFTRNRGARLIERRASDSAEV